MSFFSKGKGREKLLQQSPVFASDGHSWGSGCTVHTGSSPGACQPPNQPSSQEGVTTSLSSAKVLWLTSKLSVTEGRGGQRESQTLGKMKTSGRREQENEEGDAPGRRRRWRGPGARGRNGRRQPGHGGQRLRSSIGTRCGFGPPLGGNLAPPSFLSGCPAIHPRGTHRGLVGATQSRLVLVNPDELLAII